MKEKKQQRKKECVFGLNRKMEVEILNQLAREIGFRKWHLGKYLKKVREKITWKSKGKNFPVEETASGKALR